MLIAFDIGNTNTVAGVFEKDALRQKFRYHTSNIETADELALKISMLLKEQGIEKKDIASVIVCSVVPALTGAYVDIAKRIFGADPIVVGPGIKTGIALLYDNPREVGADRIANTVGGFVKYGGPLIVVDLGTAITFDAVSAKGEYLGGVIAPGIDASMLSLSKRAAQLPQVGLEKPSRVIGKNTVAAMQSGAVFGFCGLIDTIARKMQKEMGGNPKVVATGGQSYWLKEVSETIEAVDPDLTLHGLLEIWKRNQ
ncbi:MAG: type III pantothenate kinase [Nitrospinae bacterium]|nr:type III pantothenate kinase [Nitrospinota bacterium]